MFVRPLVPFGAEVIGAPLNAPLSADTADAIRAQWLQHGILLFRGAGDSEEKHMRLSEVFGTVQPAATKVNRNKDNPLLMEVVHDPSADKLKTCAIDKHVLAWEKPSDHVTPSRSP